MSNLIANKTGKDAESAGDALRTNSDTFESDILKNVIRENWKEETNLKKVSKETLFDLDQHASNMRKILSTYDYEIASMPVIVSNVLRMGHEEVRSYLMHLEAIAVGYANLLGSELTNIIMMGLPRKAKDLRTVTRYTNTLVKELEKRHGQYRGRATRESEAIEGISRRLAATDSGILRFFRRAKIIRLKRRINRKSSKIERYQSKASRYSYILDKVKEKSAPANPKK